jgi:hypothetical protein
VSAPPAAPVPPRILVVAHDGAVRSLIFAVLSAEYFSPI